LISKSLQTYTRRTTHGSTPPPASVPSPVQESNETVTAQLNGNSTTDDLLIALQKSKALVLSNLFPILFLILIYPLLFVHLFHLWTHAQFPKNVSKAMSIPG